MPWADNHTQICMNCSVGNYAAFSGVCIYNSDTYFQSFQRIGMYQIWSARSLMETHALICCCAGVVFVLMRFDMIRNVMLYSSFNSLSCMLLHMPASPEVDFATHAFSGAHAAWLARELWMNAAFDSSAFLCAGASICTKCPHGSYIGTTGVCLRVANYIRTLSFWIYTLMIGTVATDSKQKGFNWSDGILYWDPWKNTNSGSLWLA